MPRLRARYLLAPVLALGTLGVAGSADAQEAQVQAPPPQYAPPQPQYAPPPQLQAPPPAPPQYVPQPQPQYAPQPQLAPLPPAQPPPTTVIIQQPYPQQPYAQPGYPPQQQYYGQPPAPLAPPAPPAPTGPRIIQNWDTSQPTPPGYRVETHARLGLIIGGACLFGSVYLLTAFGASVADDAGGSLGALYVPGIGPFIAIGQAGSSTGGFFLAIDGLAQVGGIAMLAAGLALPRHDLVRNDFGVQWSLSPIVARNQTGMGVVGRF